MIVRLHSKTTCQEFTYWERQEVNDLVNFLIQQDQFVFLKAAACIRNYYEIMSSDQLIEKLALEILDGLTTQQMHDYQERLLELLTMLITLYSSAGDRSELNYLRSAVVEKLLSFKIYPLYPSNNGHHCKIECEGNFISETNDVDIAGWDNSAKGEFYECKSGAFSRSNSENKYKFLCDIKRKVGSGSIVAIFCLTAVIKQHVDEYHNDGIELFDRFSLAKKFF